ncbi:MAG: hypothetical protein ACRCT1_15775 [Microcoleaceae cyanobacterium]|jgi:nucleoid-associated protein YgaU
MTGFNNGSLKGGFGFQDQGTRKVTNADGTVSTVSYSALRTANFDGNGTHTGKGFVSIDGQEVGYSVTGSYTVDNDGTFSLDATQSYEDGRASQPYKQFGVVIRGGNEILVIQTTHGKNQSGKYQSQTNY